MSPDTGIGRYDTPKREQAERENLIGILVEQVRSRVYPATGISPEKFFTNGSVQDHIAFPYVRLLEMGAKEAFRQGYEYDTSSNEYYIPSVVVVADPATLYKKRGTAKLLGEKIPPRTMYGYGGPFDLTIFLETVTSDAKMDGASLPPLEKGALDNLEFNISEYRLREHLTGDSDSHVSVGRSFLKNQENILIVFVNRNGEVRIAPATLPVGWQEKIVGPDGRLIYSTRAESQPLIQTPDKPVKHH